MATTYSSLTYHIVFSTKNRAPLIAPEWEARLHGYLGGTVAGLGGVSLGIGGVADHVHVLASLNPTDRLADFMRELKKASSRWVHDELSLPSFGWQEGYAAFTAGSSDLDRLRAYVASQPKHHQKLDSKEELLRLCQDAGIDVDMRFFE